MSELSYTIYEPAKIEKDPVARADELLFIKDGFAFWAMIAPPLWMIYHHLWRPLIGFVVVLILVKALIWLFGLEPQAGSLLIIGLSIGFGFLANDIRRLFLEKDQYHMIGAISGPSQIECERRFFYNWHPLSNRLQNEENRL